MAFVIYWPTTRPVVPSKSQARIILIEAHMCEATYTCIDSLYIMVY